MAEPAAGPRFVYLGTSAFAAIVLRGLEARELRPVLVITPPDRPRGRGRRMTPPPAAEAAAELGLELHQTADVNDDASLAAIAAAAPDVGAVCAFGQLVRAELLARLELLNVHPSLLPRWRGAAPIERAIMAGDRETGVAVIRLVEALDAGPVALVERVAIEAGEDFGSLEERLARLGGELLARALRLHAAGELELEPQDEAGVTYAQKIDPAERRLDPVRPADELERVVRALTPHVGAHLELADGGRLGVVRATAERDDGLAVGELAARDGALALGCGEGSLRIETVRPAGRNAMPAADFLRGHPVPRLRAAGG